MALTQLLMLIRGSGIRVVVPHIFKSYYVGMPHPPNANVSTDLFDYFDITTMRQLFGEHVFVSYEEFQRRFQGRVDVVVKVTGQSNATQCSLLQEEHTRENLVTPRNAPSFTRDEYYQHDKFVKLVLNHTKVCQVREPEFHGQVSTRGTGGPFTASEVQAWFKECPPQANETCIVYMKEFKSIYTSQVHGGTSLDKSIFAALYSRKLLNVVHEFYEKLMYQADEVPLITFQYRALKARSVGWPRLSKRLNLFYAMITELPRMVETLQGRNKSRVFVATDVMIIPDGGLAICLEKYQAVLKQLPRVVLSDKTMALCEASKLDPFTCSLYVDVLMCGLSDVHFRIRSNQERLIEFVRRVFGKPSNKIGLGDFSAPFFDR